MTQHTDPTDADIDFDMIIVGAGFSGIEMLRQARSMNLSATVLEAGSDIGGTWYWNRYPGARTDSEAWYYCYSHDPAVLESWNWSERYPGHAEMRRYFDAIDQRYEVRRDIRFNTRMEAARYDEATKVWHVDTNTGQSLTCRYLVTAIGIMSERFLPDIEGIDCFAGERYVTARWPKVEPDFSGKRVGVIGAGASAIQAIPLIAEQAESLTVFQRTANYVLPANNHDLDDEAREAIRGRYDEIWDEARGHFFGMPFKGAGRLAVESTPQERERIFEDYWARGGFRFIFETFDDLLTDPAANEMAAEFIRRKIRETVHDAETAEDLCPVGYPFGGKRPPNGTRYYETYNRDNVELVNLKKNPIEAITPSGVRTADKAYEFDVLVFATGFDAVTGAFTSVDIRGREGRALSEHWQDGPRTLFGLGTHGFPNLFMVFGPQTPFANNPLVIEQSAQIIAGLVNHMRANDIVTAEVTPEAEAFWLREVEDCANATVVPMGANANSWIYGANIPGKARACTFYFGGLGVYVDHCEREMHEGYPHFEMRRATEAATPAAMASGG